MWSTRSKEGASTHSGQPSPGRGRDSSCRKRGTKMQSRLEVPADQVDPDSAVVIEQAGAVEDGEPADVAGPAIAVPLQQEQVRRRQPFRGDVSRP